jgi:hypothetical protein
VPVYRPSAVIRLVIRLDEGGSTAELLSRLEAPKTGALGSAAVQVVTQSARGPEIRVAAAELSTLHKLSELAGQGDPQLQARLDAALARKRGLDTPTNPEVPVALQEVEGPLSIVVTLPVLKCEVERASFRTGDKASFTLNYFDAPFDPRLIRACGIEVLIGIMTPEEHDAGMHGLTRDDGSRYSTVEDAPGLQSATRFVGFVEKWNLNISDGGATIEGSATDLMSIMRDTQLPPDMEIDHELPLDEGVTQLLQAFPALRGIVVTYGRPGLEGQIAPTPENAASRRKKVVKKGKKRIRRNAENTTIWDHITDVCIGSGVVPVISGVGLRIEPARTLLGMRPQVPKMVWGQNLTELSFERQLGGFKNPTVEIRCYSPDDRCTYAARYPDPTGFGVAILGTRPFPPVPKRANLVTPSGKNPDQTVHVMTISGVGPSALEDVARGIYEETARQEIEGSFQTDDPSTFGVDFAEADLLDLKAGDPIAIEIDQRGQGELADVVSELQGMTVQARVAHLLDRGFRRRVAIAYAILVDQANLQTIFRVSGTRIGFDHEDGLSLDVDFQNYITLRGETPEQHAAEASPQVQAATRGQKGPLSTRARKKSARVRPPTETPVIVAPAAEPSLMERAPGSEYDGEVYADPQTRF